MLTIQNLNLLLKKKVNPQWTVTSIFEEPSAYCITIQTDEFASKRRLFFSRFVEFTNSGIGHYYFFNEQGKKTHMALTLEQIKDINNVVSALNWFTT
jgi:hypothetical protein